MDLLPTQSSQALTARKHKEPEPLKVVDLALVPQSRSVGLMGIWKKKENDRLIGRRISIAKNVRSRADDDLFSRLVLQPHNSGVFDACSYYVVANLFVLIGQPPPPVDEMIAFMKGMDAHRDDEGLTASGIAQLLDVTGFPGIVTQMNVPTIANIAAIIKSAIEQGWLLVLTYCFVSELDEEGAIALGDKDFAGIKIWTTHALIPFAVDLEAREMDCVVGWERLPTARVKIEEIMAPDWLIVGCGAQPVGIARGMIQIWPAQDSWQGKGN